MASDALADPPAPKSATTAVPVHPGGTFAFRLKEGLTSVFVAAIGPGCIATTDVEAQTGEPTVIPLGGLYGLRYEPVNAEDGGPVAYDFVPTGGGGVGISFTGEGLLPGLESTIARRYLSQQYPPVAPPLLTSFAAVAGPQAEAPTLAVTVDLFGYEKAEFVQDLLPLIGRLETTRMPLIGDGSSVGELVVVSDRDGQWDLYEDYDYKSVAALEVPDSQFRRIAGSAVFVDLRPGTRSLAGFPEDAPRVHLRRMLLARFEVQPHELVTALGVDDAQLKNSVTIPGSSLGALAIPPQEDPPDPHAWIGLHGEGMKSVMSLRYDAASGVLLDGLVPGDYSLYWAPERKAYFEKLASRLPIQEIHVDPGLSEFMLP